MSTKDYERLIKELQPQQKYAITNDDTYGTAFIKQLLNKRVMWRAADDFIYSEDDKTAYVCKAGLLRYIRGRNKSPSAYVIFRMREHIRPAEWIYLVNEPLPKPIKFTPKHSDKDLTHLMSCGLEMLKKMVSDYSFQHLEDTFGPAVSENRVKNMLYKHLDRSSGMLVYKSLPQQSFMRALRNVINPDYWFIFPDELE